ncbi:MAG: DUF305 domain-containing protein [Ilumatobacteraceae bacterium]|nr:DUF305 domain-containing protein [Ilumatobacteraceae bacterium]
MTTANLVQDSDESVEVRPWWQNPLNFVAIAVAGLVLGVGIGYFAGDSLATPDVNEVDEGFLQDMRYHHDQAVQMAYFYLTEVDEPHPRLSMLAEEILLSQQMEAGRMVQMLRNFGLSEVNDTGVAMGWMGHEMPIDEMDGLASQEQLDEFAAATGDEASRIFAELMIEHHRGGVHMAEYAVDRADNSAVRSFAQSMIRGQSAEITELQTVVDELSKG